MDVAKLVGSFVGGLALTAGCAQAPAAELRVDAAARSDARATAPTPAPELARTLDDLGLVGTLVLFDPARATFEASDPERAARGFLPASTFKIVNALIGLDAGSVADEHELFRWDGVDRGSDGWNRDHDLASAMCVSAVWVFQELARRTGGEKLQEGVDRLGYGNRDLGGALDSFWLDGALRVSARQQIDLLVGLERGALPCSARSQEIVRRILERERGDGFVVRGKTGWANACTPPVGWYVGWVERAAGPLFFALNADLASVADAPKRIEVVRRVLVARGVLPEGASGGR
ncbi:MAG TPA: penicillin-binding transpeptidase domain-containing protein [Planctomycetota bacterium]|jgi:beta-lactamase class D|nr:penicillin-binding transpeptidase domain-containing protein [Planctomycetota bacterium]